MCLTCDTSCFSTDLKIELVSLSSMRVSVCTGEGDSNVYGALGAKFGAGAAKIGKKAAQSEAGRSAGKAAIKGATDSVQKDLTDRYLQQGDYSSAPTPAPAPTPKETAKPQESTKEHSSSTSASRSSSEPSPFAGSYSRVPKFEGQHQKATFFSKFKPSINTHHKSSKAPVRPRQLPRGEKVYKHRLAKDADWEQLPLAQALYHFKGELKCDLEFRKGQVIKVVTRTDTQFDWWEGKIEDRVGIFPANYVKLL